MAVAAPSSKAIGAVLFAVALAGCASEPTPVYTANHVEALVTDKPAAQNVVPLKASLLSDVGARRA
jgi:hypothetical protein